MTRHGLPRPWTQSFDPTVEEREVCHANSEKIFTPDRTSATLARELLSSRRRYSSQRAEADADQGLAARTRSLKVVADVERNRCKISDLTVDDARSMAADMTARVAALRRRWEESGDLQALFGALNFYQQQLPEWLFKGLMQNFEQQFKNPDAIRFLAVRHAHDALGKTMDESYDWASKNVTEPIAKGGRDSMMKSYQKIRPRVPQIDRIRPRPRARRRRS